MLFLQLIFIAYFTGLTCRKLATWFDYSMDYGNIFWMFRKCEIRRFAKDKAGYDLAIEKAIAQDVDERMNLVDRVYREHATNYSRWILCKICIGSRFLVLFSVVIFALFVGDWSYFPLFIFLTLTGFVE